MNAIAKAVVVALTMTACGGGGSTDGTPAAVPSEVAPPMTQFKMAAAWPGDLAQLDPAAVTIAARFVVALTPSKDLTTDVTTAAAAAMWQWEFPAMVDGTYTVAMTYWVAAIPVAHATVVVPVANGNAAASLTLDSFSDMGGGDVDQDGVNNLQEILTKTNPQKADSDGDGVMDGVDFFPLDANESSDSDGDGLGDKKDNCPAVANFDQKNTDSDSSGDVCDMADDRDDDSDGLTNSVELLKGTNPKKADSDGDTVSDSQDAFPLDPTESSDTDKDGVGAVADNCPQVANADQTNTDKALFLKGVPVAADGLGDACDSDPDGDGRNVVYLDGKNGTDTTQGYYTQPVKTLVRAQVLAAAVDADVWLAAGDYDVSSVVWQGGLKFFGGYTAAFDPKTRDVRATDLAHRVRFVAAGKASVLTLQNINKTLHFDGIHIESGAQSALTAAVVLIDHSLVTLSQCAITGSPTSVSDSAVQIQNNSIVRLEANTLQPQGFGQGVASSGVTVQQSNLTAVNNIIKAGAGNHATAVSLNTAAAVLSNNTIDARSNVQSQAMATGITLIATAPKLLNNLVMVSGNQVEGIYFEKNTLVPAGTLLKNNLVMSGGAPAPLLRDWNGVAYTSIASGDFQAIFSDGSSKLFASVLGVTSAANLTSAAALTTIFNTQYLPVLGSPLIDQATSSLDPALGGVSSDWSGSSRASKGSAYDIGALEY